MRCQNQNEQDKGARQQKFTQFINCVNKITVATATTATTTILALLLRLCATLNFSFKSLFKT